MPVTFVEEKLDCRLIGIKKKKKHHKKTKTAGNSQTALPNKPRTANREPRTANHEPKQSLAWLMQTCYQ